jgi:hypothetical protein
MNPARWLAVIAAFPSLVLTGVSPHVAIAATMLISLHAGPRVQCAVVDHTPPRPLSHATNRASSASVRSLDVDSCAQFPIIEALPAV